MSDRIVDSPGHDGIDRRGFLECMAWAGAGMVWAVSGGILTSRALGTAPAQEKKGDFSFVQISDSHIGFAKPPNKDVVGTLKRAVAKIKALETKPDVLIHTGDLTHLSKPAEFDTVAEVLKEAKVGQTFFVPGEHDIFTDDGKLYLERHGKGTKGLGWHSYTHKGCRFIGLVNVANLKPGGLGTLGKEQLDWLKKDVANLGDSTPIVVYAHVPLWTVYEKWGWGTDDAAQALALLKRFGSVTVLNGHVHQTMKKVEGKVTFHTACSTAFPQPAPGKADSPEPIKGVAADKLRGVLGITRVNYVESKSSLAIIDSSLE
jgi:3',5'-cyclic AMP phosphodiesterase CpdA